MKGTVKWFSGEEKYGFISVPEGKDHFFHVTDLKGTDIPNIGDSVVFEPRPGKDGKPAATEVDIFQRNETISNAPYHAFITVTRKVENGKAVEKGTGRGWAIVSGLIGMHIGNFLAGVVGGAVLGIIGALVGWEFRNKGIEEIKEEVEITSTCLKCGGMGQVTAINRGLIGFQCEKCKSHWREQEARIMRTCLMCGSEAAVSGYQTVWCEKCKCYWSTGSDESAG